MQDVANLSYVSKQTVSAVINGKPGITEETRVRVLAAIEQVNYRMDLTARSLRTGRTHTVALLVTDISSPVLGTMASAAVKPAVPMAMASNSERPFGKGTTQSAGTRASSA